MIRVRFSTGLVLQYNDVFYVDGSSYTGKTAARDKQGGRLIALIPNECVVEYDHPCRVFQQRGEADAERVDTIVTLKRRLTLARQRVRALRQAAKTRERT